MFRLLKNLNKKDYLYIFLSIVLICFQVYLDLKIPDYMSEITKMVQSSINTTKDILVQGSYMLACAFGSLLAAVVVGYFISDVSATFSKITRRKLFTKVENLSTQDIKSFQTGSLITRTTNDISQVQMLLGMGLQLLIKAPITAIWAVLKILNKNWEWTLITGICLVVMLITIGILVIIVLPKFKRVQKLIDSLNTVTRENLKGIRVIRAFNAENYQQSKFKDVNDELTNLQLFNQKKLTIISPMMYLVMYLLTLSIYFVGAYLIKDTVLSSKIALFGDMIVFSSYAMQVIMSFLMLAMVLMILPRAQVSIKRINEVLDIKDSIKDGNIINKKEVGTIEFDSVSFKYPDADEELLSDISFKVKKGETVAFIGSTGSGKSTLINLILRFYDVTKGSIKVDGVNIKDFKEDYLNNLIGYVPQKAVLFNGSVKFNVKYGKELSDEKFIEALKVSQAYDFVSKMDNTFDYNISQGGSNISGGQKQRLCIARAIAKSPEIYIFDDSFSALDYKTDSILRKELKKYTKDATILIVAQRIGTIMNADKIVVLDNGSLVGIGTHKELLKKCKVYQEIALSQLSKEELENE